VVSPVNPGNCWDSTLKLGHDRFLPHPIQFIIHVSYFHSTKKAQVSEKSVGKKVQDEETLLLLFETVSDMANI
jgi:hypothetical protein